MVGDRDEEVILQIRRISAAHRNDKQRPVVVLQFRAVPLAGNADAEGAQQFGTRGSQFERCLSLARFLTSSEVSRVRLIAFIPDTLEGHAVLPTLACEDIIVSSSAEVGRASIDESPDATIRGAYRDVVSRRAALPPAIVMSMLDANAEVYSVSLQDGSNRVIDRTELDELRAAGEILEEQTLWAGGTLASYVGQLMRNRRWILGNADDASELAVLLNLKGTFRTAKQLPRDWIAMAVTIDGALNNGRVNQIVRSVNELVDKDALNLLVLRIKPTQADQNAALRLAAFLASKESDQLYTLGIVDGEVRGPVALLAPACDEAVLVGPARLGPDTDDLSKLFSEPSMLLALDDLANSSERPLPLLGVLIDPSVQVQEYVHQQSGRRRIFTVDQVASQADRDLWLAKRNVAGGDLIENEVALRYRLVDSVDATETVALARLGVNAAPEELQTSWVDGAVQLLLAQGWLPRLLLTIGFFALMAELGNPGLSVGGLLAGLSFLGFFWIEALNGNVEALEVMLFVAGVVALALELFVVPGFGLFGISGLLMLLVSVVLASQTFVWPTTSAQLSELSVNLFWVACLALCGMIGLLFMHRQLEKTPFMRWISLQPASEEDAVELGHREATAHREHLYGQEGLTTTRLNPAGKAQFGSDIVSVVSVGTMIDEGVPVQVVEVQGSVVTVEELT